MIAAKQAVRIGAGEVQAKYLRGELSREHVIVAARGAEKYAVALARGDCAEDEVASERVNRCATCPSMTMTDTGSELDGGIVIKCWCGPALEDHTKGVLPTCGCLVALRVNGQMLPAGKSLVGSEACDQERWTS
jgi:hypothetical protein